MVQAKFLLLFLLTFPAAADLDFMQPYPEDFNKVDMYLQTVGVGEDLYMVGGHSLLRVHDKSNGMDVIYNWGVFDFGEPIIFALNFVRGYLIYRMDQFGMRSVMNVYRRERRSLVQEKLNLTIEQKKTLMKRIRWQSKRENRFYPYHYYWSNCATYIRDYLDEAFKGGLKKFFAGRMGDETLRESFEKRFANHPMIMMITEVLMNDEMDLQMTDWQEMYLPITMQPLLQEVPQFDDNGQQIPGTKLLSDPIVFLDYPEPQPSPLNGYQIVFFVFLVPILWSGMLFLKTTSQQAVAYRMLGIAALLWGIFAGVFGLSMIVIWSFTEHTHGYHSASLWMFWPFDFLFCYLGWYYLKNAQGLAKETKVRKYACYLCYAHLITIPLLALLWGIGFIKQDVSNSLTYFAPVAMMILALIVRYGLSCKVSVTKK